MVNGLGYISATFEWANMLSQFTYREMCAAHMVKHGSLPMLPRFFVPQVLCSPLSTKKVSVRDRQGSDRQAGLGLQGPSLCSPGPMFLRDEKSNSKYNEQHKKSHITGFTWQIASSWHHHHHGVICNVNPTINTPVQGNTEGGSFFLFPLNSPKVWY